MIKEASNSVSDYVRQVVPNPYFSPTHSKLFVSAGGADLNFSQDYMQQGARLIHVHSVIVNIKATVGGGPSMNLVDSLGNVLMVLTQQVSMNGLYPLDFIINSGLIKLTLVGSAAIVANIDMTVQYQFIKDAPIKK